MPQPHLFTPSDLYCVRCGTKVGTTHDKMVPAYCARCLVRGLEEKEKEEEEGDA